MLWFVVLIAGLLLLDPPWKAEPDLSERASAALDKLKSDIKTAEEKVEKLKKAKKDAEKGGTATTGNAAAKAPPGSSLLQRVGVATAGSGAADDPAADLATAELELQSLREKQTRATNFLSNEDRIALFRQKIAELEKQDAEQTEANEAWVEERKQLRKTIADGGVPATSEQKAELDVLLQKISAGKKVGVDLGKKIKEAQDKLGKERAMGPGKKWLVGDRPC